MIKKILISLLLWLNFTGTAVAKDIEFAELRAGSYGDLVYISTNMMMVRFQPNPKDWIAIYKVGDSNDWENVKLWTWAKNMIENEMHGDKGERSYEFKNLTLPTGEYEARYFLNNSYTTRISSKPFRHVATSNKLHPFYSTAHHSLNIEIKNKNFKPNPKDWIGVYSRNDSSAWENVRAWTWAKNFKKNPSGNFEYQFENLSLPTGYYRVRYFLNNTYKENEQSNTFEVEVPISEELLINFLKSTQNTNKRIYLEIKRQNFDPNPKDWIGIYKVGTSNDWDNVKAWVWAKDLKAAPGAFYHNFSIKNFPSGEYEARYFLNNTFVTEKTSKSIWVH